MGSHLVGTDVQGEFLVLGNLLTFILTQLGREHVEHSELYPIQLTKHQYPLH